MERFWSALVLLNYLVMAILSFSSIENYGLYRLLHPIQTYHPFYSELFSLESLLVLMSVAAATFMQWAEKEVSATKTRKLQGFVAILFAILAVPVKLMTRGLIIYDTSFYAFVLFFSLFLLLTGARSLFTEKEADFREMSAIVVAIALFFVLFEPWNSPSVKLQNAIEAGNTETFASLARRYPAHLSLNSNLLNTAFDRPDPRIIKIIVESGNKYVYARYMNKEIFNPKHLEILKYLYANGVDLAQSDVLRSAVEYYAQKTEKKPHSAEPEQIDQAYPVMKWLISIANAAPATERKPDSGLFSGFTNLLSIAAAAGDADLMDFMINQGFVIDEEVFRALVLNDNLKRPEIQTLLARVSTASVELTGEAGQSSVTGQQKAQSAMTAGELALPASAAVTPAVAVGSLSEAAVRQPATASPTENAAQAPSDKGLIPWLQPADDGLDLVIAQGADVKSMRLARENLFHFIARYWRSPRNERSHYKFDYQKLFRIAVDRGIDIEQKNTDALTPLWVAMHANNFRAFKKLLEAGADTEVKNPDGKHLREACGEMGRKLLLGLIEGEAK